MPVNSVIVFVHGWSVTSTDTYGGLPNRLRAEAAAQEIALHIEEIYLSRYISFHDEVRLSDISLAFRTALNEELAEYLISGIRFVCVTHSTGGPVVRDWWQRYYNSQPGAPLCPMSHLIMLAPANYGSALAQLGKGRLSRMKSWFEGVEPGQGVLDWLELGSAEAWQLNSAWIAADATHIGPAGIFPFVLTGQSIDRSFYDNLNTYSGETGSDGVVRVAAANLCGTFIQLEQETPYATSGSAAGYAADGLYVKQISHAPETALRVLPGKSHTGTHKGIMFRVAPKAGNDDSSETITAMLACLQVQSREQYAELCDQFRTETAAVQEAERVEVETHLFLSNTHFIHDRYSMVIFRVRDDQGHPVTDYDLLLTAGEQNDPNHLPQGFAVDRQRNSVTTEVVTYYFNYDIMNGTPEVVADDGTLLRRAIKGAGMLGFKLIARPDSGFVRYLPCEIEATTKMLQNVLQPNSTTLLDIVLRRIVSKNVFVTERLTEATEVVDFSATTPGTDIVV
jgi:hypothetical protein